jgi:hypothetical protein
VNNFNALLVYFPLLRNGIVLSTHKKFDAPDYKRKVYVHPPPPHLRRVIEDYGIPSSETLERWYVAKVTYGGDVNKQ